jgi:hypothetical protein
LAVPVEPETARGSGLAASNPTGVWAAQGEQNRPVSVAEFLFIASVVGVLTKTWLGFLGTFVGFYALYRFTRLSAVLSLALSLYWGLLGYHLGVSTDEVGVAPLLAGLAFAIGAWVHRDGFLGAVPAAPPSQPGPLATDASVHQRVSADPDRPFPGEPTGEIIDADYRVVS